MSEAMCAGCGRWPVYYETTQSCSTCLPGRASEVIVDLLARAEAAERERDEARAEVERLRDRLQTAVDEQVSPHETLPAEELITLLEHSLAEGRYERERLRQALAALAGEASGPGRWWWLKPGGEHGRCEATTKIGTRCKMPKPCYLHTKEARDARD